MSGQEINVNLLHGTVLREIENDTVQELAPDLYLSISEFLGKLRREEYDGVEGKIKNVMISITSVLAEILLGARLAKSIGGAAGCENLLYEEKFILDADGEMRERRDMILAGVLNGKSKLIESISDRHKTKLIVVRFLQEMDQMVGVDLEKYGPFHTEDIATIPYENAQALMAKKIVTKIRWED